MSEEKIIIEQLHKEDFDECMDLIDLVFSQAHRPHDFRASVPKTNRPEEELMNRYFGLRENGKLCSSILCWPMEARIGGHDLRFFSLGNVATLHRCGGKGYMAQVMNRVQEYMKESGADLCELGGLRQRYGFYGYERCGERFRFTLSRYNCQKSFLPEKEYSFAPLLADDAAAVMFCRKLYESSPVYNRRGDDRQFVNHLLSFGNRPELVKDQNGVFCGYLVQYKGHINEIGLQNTKDALQVCDAYLRQNDLEEVTVDLRWWQQDLLREFDRISEEISVKSDHQFKVFRWDRVVKAFFDVKAAVFPLLPGRAVIGIEGWGNLSIEVTDGTAAVQKTEEEAQLFLSRSEAHRFIFGPVPGTVAPMDPVFANWFPLPLGWNSNDCV